MQRPATWAPIVLLLAGAALAAVYKWTDEQGRTHFSDHPPAGQASEPVPIEPAPAATPAAPGLRPTERQWLEQRSQEASEQSQRQMREQAEPAGKIRRALGSIVLDFRIQPGAELPLSAMDVALLVMPASGGEPQRYPFPAGQRDWAEWRDKSPELARALATYNFDLPLPAGRYRLERVEIRAPSLAGRVVHLPLNASFEVSDEHDCVYLGRALLRYVRLPPGNRTMQNIELAGVEHRFGAARGFVYLENGGLVLVGRELEIQPSENPARSLIKKSREPYLRATRQGCAMQPARFQ